MERSNPPTRSPMKNEPALGNSSEICTFVMKYTTPAALTRHVPGKMSQGVSGHGEWERGGGGC